MSNFNIEPKSYENEEEPIPEVFELSEESIDSEEISEEQKQRATQSLSDYVPLFHINRVIKYPAKNPNEYWSWGYRFTLPPTILNADGHYEFIFQVFGGFNKAKKTGLYIRANSSKWKQIISVDVMRIVATFTTHLKASLFKKGSNVIRIGIWGGEGEFQIGRGVIHFREK